MKISLCPLSVLEIICQVTLRFSEILRKNHAKSCHNSIVSREPKKYADLIKSRYIFRN